MYILIAYKSRRRCPLAPQLYTGQIKQAQLAVAAFLLAQDQPDQMAIVYQAHLAATLG
jgi:hypothetical protein